jgi:hypothetical protein
MIHPRSRTPFLVLAVAASCGAVAGEPTPDQIEFFEKRIRPVLSETCYKCHSSTSEKLKGGLMLDSREDLLKGGDTGPAVVPGNLEKSLLIEAIRWTNDDLQMPPKKRLTPQQVGDLEAWVKAGSPWPREAAPKKAPKVVFDLQKRKQEHWCWKPPLDVQPPKVKAVSWPLGSIDPFILAKLEEKGLKPAPAAEKRTLIRRATFDLIGLPPAPAEVEAFVNDGSPDAFAKVVDRLLASPHFGERWARHWLDLVRYAETRGHEFDPEIPNAWQYRDYVVRSLNADVPYDQFALEHIAGDLIKPRVNPASGANESILGTGFWFLGEEVHSPVDIRLDETDRMDNRLDVMSKTFLSLTVACARCHDHKFDAISQRDYTALTGFLISSTYRQARFETMEQERQIAEQLDRLRQGARQQVLDAFRQSMARGVAQTADFLLAARDVLQGTNATDVAAVYSVDASSLATWVAELSKAKTDTTHTFHLFAKIAVEAKANDPAEFARRLTALIGKTDAKPGALQLPDGASVVADFSKSEAHGRLQNGVSFGPRPLLAGDAIFGTAPERPLLGIATRGGAYRDPAWKNLIARDSEEDVGTLGKWQRAGQTIRTPDVTLKAKSLWYLVKGSGRAYAAVNSHLIVKGPLHGAVLKEWKTPGDRWQWIEHSLPAYEGHRLHVQFSPKGAEDFAIAMVVQSNTAPPLPQGWNRQLVTEVASASAASPETLAKATQGALASACAKLGVAPVPAKPDAGDSAEICDWMVRNLDLFCPPGSTAGKQLAEATRSFSARQSELIARIRPESRTAPAMLEGSGTDEFLLTRGSSKLPGAPVPRRFLEAIAGTNQPPITEGSGRLELARRIIDPANPFTARAIVNRVWHHLFGRGIVPTVDNFGVLGQAPSHPELLDHLAARFISVQAWSLKKLMREVMLSRTYQMASQPGDATAEQADPENILLHRMNLRRLEGEAIRDAILAVSGRLNPKAGGPSVPVNLTAFMDGRGRPGRSGPLDGDGRRSIYIAVRRNFLQPMMLAFDTPIPFSSVGRRNVSNVPAQALILMNDPFVVEQAKIWASHLPSADAQTRIAQMYLSAFSRQPTGSELADANAFLQTQSALYATKDTNDPRIWADLCHVLFNVKEFIHLD